MRKEKVRDLYHKISGWVSESNSIKGEKDIEFLSKKASSKGKKAQNLRQRQGACRHWEKKGCGEVGEQ